MSSYRPWSSKHTLVALLVWLWGLLWSLILIDLLRAAFHGLITLLGGSGDTRNLLLGLGVGMGFSLLAAAIDSKGREVDPVDIASAQSATR